MSKTKKTAPAVAGASPAINIGIGEKDRGAIAAALSRLLADRALSRLLKASFPRNLDELG